MTRLYPPLIPGFTDVSEGSEQNQTLYNLVTLQRRNPELFPPPFGEALKGLSKLYTPQEPPPEPAMTSLAPPTGRTLGGY